MDRRKTIDGRIHVTRPVIRRNSISIDDHEGDIISPNNIKAEKSEVGTISVRTPIQVNESIRNQIIRGSVQRQAVPNQQQLTRVITGVNKNGSTVVLKRLGNTTIRSLPPISQTLVTRSGPPITLRRMSAITPEMRQQHPKINHVIDIRDHIIKELQEQNREMKKTLFDFKKETAAMNARLKTWADTIDVMLVKFSRLSQPRHTIVNQNQPNQNNVNQIAKKSTSQVSPSPREQMKTPTNITFKEPSPRVESPAHSNSPPSPKIAARIIPDRTAKPRYLPEVMASQIRVPANPTPAPQVRIVVKPLQPTLVAPNPSQKRKLELDEPEEGEKMKGFVTPKFPLTNFDDLVESEELLHQIQYFAHVKRVIYANFSGMFIEKPSLMLDIVLKSIIHSDLMKILKHSEEKTEDNPQEDIRDFPMVIDLFSSLVNMVSMNKFKKRVDPKSIQEFLKRKFTKRDKKIEKAAKVTETTAPQSTPEIPEKPKIPAENGSQIKFDTNPAKIVKPPSPTVENKNGAEVPTNNDDNSDEELFTLE